MDPSNIHILIVDGQPASARFLSDLLSAAGYQLAVVSNESEAVNLARQQLFNVVVKSFDAERINAVAVMDKIRAVAPDTQFIFVSERGTIRTAVEAIQKGAYDYLSRPIDPPQLVESVKKALEYQRLVTEDERLKLRLRPRSEPNFFVGTNAAVGRVSRLVQQIAPTDVTVLIEGESGTGKEITARAIHHKSRRSAHPFVAVNCAALPDNLIEAELFGHVRGAFTGAIHDRPGRFQLARGGTLFLDEIGDLSPKGQADLLRVVEDGMFRPVGSHKMERGDVRIITASNKNLELETSKGRFREDLFYRLNIVVINLPPLRERIEDIPALTESFIQHFCAKHRRRLKKIDKKVLAMFQTLSWPGNVRQLRNLVERLVVTVPRTRIELADLPPELFDSTRRKQEFVISPGMTMAQVEAELIRQTLLSVTPNRAAAAQKLGISRRTLQYKIRRYGVDARRTSERAEDKRSARHMDATHAG